MSLSIPCPKCGNFSNKQTIDATGSCGCVPFVPTPKKEESSAKVYVCIGGPLQGQVVQINDPEVKTISIPLNEEDKKRTKMDAFSYELMDLTFGAQVFTVFAPAKASVADIFQVLLADATAHFILRRNIMEQMQKMQIMQQAGKFPKGPGGMPTPPKR